MPDPSLKPQRIALSTCGSPEEAALNELHSYELPEFVVLPIDGGSAAYLAWIDANVSQTS